MKVKILVQVMVRTDVAAIIYAVAFLVSVIL